MTARTKFWLITGVSLLAMGCTAALGRWQLSRAAEKTHLQAAIEAQGQQPALDGATLTGQRQGESLIHRAIVVRGQWLAERTIFLDNRQMHGKPGLYVVTPLQIEEGRAVVLVQRGWVQRNFQDRVQLPKIDTPQGMVEVRGRIAPAPAKLYELGEAQSGAIRQNLDLAQFGAETGLSLLGVSIQQTGAATEGLLREWPPAGSGIDKHYGYAFQWFGLSALIAILYVWFQIVRRFIPQRDR